MFINSSNIKKDLGDVGDPIFLAKIRQILIDDINIQSIIAKDKNGNLSIRPGNYAPIGGIFPCLILSWKEGKSDSIFPHQDGHLYIYIWYNEDKDSQQYSKMNYLKHLVLNLFNRHGNDLNNIDLVKNKGLRINQITKQSSDFEFDDQIMKYCCEIIFHVQLSENESFLPSDSGDRAWV